MESLKEENLLLLNQQESAEKECELISSDSGVSSIFGTEDNPSTNSSSNDISGMSSSSGEIPAIVIEQAVVPIPIPKPEPEPVMMDDLKGKVTVTATATATAIAMAREACIGKRNKGVSWGFTSVIGRRNEMEDAVAIIPGFMSSTCNHVGGCTAPGSKISTEEISPVHFFAVYDGHGGPQVANYCAGRMHEVVAQEWGKGEADANGWRRRWEEAFLSGFEQADLEVSDNAVSPEIVGSTAVVVALSACQIITSNCGDSRAILCRGAQTIQLSVDHKPDREDELIRIEGDGGKVINWNGARVFGVLAMSRSIGILLLNFKTILCFHVKKLKILSLVP
ncbi:hypothetical protein AQUCO_02000345v1 [Aquilegia coerulea]|uniref:protein-serine/threonine phosphatase n=1 Tax=Aquilegia coerulea TaxID=218851 RepID=A0A2G5DH48_AQUCA|nr:hypothetical protein AQUCO_02000345v1 [Aquilegia coerulea]